MIRTEMHNLFYKPEYEAIKKEMLEEMRQEMKRLNDPLENWYIGLFTKYKNKEKTDRTFMNDIHFLSTL